MKATMKTTICLALALFTAAPLSSCSEDEVYVPINDGQTNPAPSITGVSPQSATEGDLITIHGSNFGTDFSKVKVFFNNLEAELITVNHAQIQTVVPENAQTGMVTIKVNETYMHFPNFIIEDQVKQ
jgi:hypothetical protein